MRSGEYVVLNANDRVDQCFGIGPTEYAQALMWAVSAAIMGRTRYTVAYLDDNGELVHLIDVAHPQTR
jgi:hypothetical protein